MYWLRVSRTFSSYLLQLGTWSLLMSFHKLNSILTTARDSSRVLGTSAEECEETLFSEDCLSVLLSCACVSLQLEQHVYKRRLCMNWWCKALINNQALTEGLYTSIVYSTFILVCLHFVSLSLAAQRIFGRLFGI